MRTREMRCTKQLRVECCECSVTTFNSTAFMSAAQHTEWNRTAELLSLNRTLIYQTQHRSSAAWSRSCTLKAIMQPCKRSLLFNLQLCNESHHFRYAELSISVTMANLVSSDNISSFKSAHKSLIWDVWNICSQRWTSSSLSTSYANRISDLHIASPTKKQNVHWNHIFHLSSHAPLSL